MNTAKKKSSKKLADGIKSDPYAEYLEGVDPDDYPDVDPLMLGMHLWGVEQSKSHIRINHERWFHAFYSPKEKRLTEEEKDLITSHLNSNGYSRSFFKFTGSSISKDKKRKTLYFKGFAEAQLGRKMTVVFPCEDGLVTAESHKKIKITIEDANGKVVKSC